MSYELGQVDGRGVVVRQLPVSHTTQAVSSVASVGILATLIAVGIGIRYYWMKVNAQLMAQEFAKVRK
jgi:hypothetical protein